MKTPLLVQRFRNALKNDGVTGTARKCVVVPIRQLRDWRQQYRRWRFNHSKDARVIFEMAYKLNFWDNKESVSGPGSTLEYTANLRRHLQIVFNDFSIKTVFDAPCGDFNWMRQVVAANPIHYRGGDIVPALIKANQAAHGNSRTDFLTFDITRDKFPEADLWICRDCLFHLSYRQIYAALKNFSTSSTRYILVTNHRSQIAFQNHDIRTGDCRMLNLMAPPFNLSSEVKYRIQEGTAADSGHEMCLWDRDQIIAALPSFELALAAIPADPA